MKKLLTILLILISHIGLTCDSIQYSIQVTEPQCHNQHAILSLTLEGNSPFDITWSNNSSDPITTFLAGDYSVTIVDVNGNRCEDYFTINQPQPIIVTNPINGQLCIGQEFKTIVQATGGTHPYTFIWTGPNNFTYYGNELVSYPEITTTYVLNVIDANGCIGPTKTVTSVVYNNFEIFTYCNKNVVCKGEQVMVDMMISGGNSPYLTRFNGQSVTYPLSFYPNESGHYYIEVDDICGTPTLKDSIYIDVYDYPQLTIYSDKTTACPNTHIHFFTETNDNLMYLWDFGNGNLSTMKNPTTTYNKSGSYVIKLIAKNQYGCTKQFVFNDMITIWAKPSVDFIANPERTTKLKSNIEFNNLTNGAIFYFWDFGDGNKSLFKNPTHRYSDIGEYYVTLTAQNTQYCLDSITKRISIEDLITFYAPTAFTPNGDEKNDEFKVFGNMISSDDFSLVVYDRTGFIVFETTEFKDGQSEGWDGTMGDINKGDIVLNTNTYYWICVFKDHFGNQHTETGFVNIIK